MTEATPRPATAFSLVRGGPLYHLALRLRLGHRPLGLAGLGVLLALLTWVPLLVLATIEGGLFTRGAAVGFLPSVATHARFLVAMPLFFLAEAWIDPRFAAFVRQIVESGLVPRGKLHILDAAVRRAERWRDSVLVEAGLAAATVALVAVGLRIELPAYVSTWRVVGTGPQPRLGLAGWWYTAAAMPLFQFVVGRWGWRLLIWVAFLWRLSRLGLDLVPIHPDHTGGLGALEGVQSYFVALSFANSAVFAAIFAESLLFAGARLETLWWPVAGIVLLNLILFVGPLLLFTPQLLGVKRQALREYGLLAGTYTRGFDAKWVRGGTPAGEPLLGSPDIQSLADLANSFAIIRDMRVIPFGRALLEELLAATLAPMVPLLLAEFGAEKLLWRVVKLLLGV